MAEEIRQPGAEHNPTSKPELNCFTPGRAISRCDRVDHLTFGATALVALLVYLSTLPPNVTLEWSGILSTGAAYAGVSPPPGYPVWTIYSWLFVNLLPFSNIAWRVAVGSAVATAMACGLVAMLVSRWGTILFSETPAVIGLKPIERKWLRGVSGLVAGLLFSLSKVIWGMAVVADIWALSHLLFIGVLSLLAHWILCPAHRWLLFLAFLLFGLLLTSSQQLILVLPGLVCAVMLVDYRVGRDLALTILPLAMVLTGANQSTLWIKFPGHLNWPISLSFTVAFAFSLVLILFTRRIGSEWIAAVFCSAGLLLGLAAYLYVPMASMSNPPVNWGYPRISEGFLHVISRGQFERASPSADLGLFGRQLLQFGTITIKNIGWPCLAFVVASGCSVYQMSRLGRRWLLGLLLIWICAGPLMVAELNPPPDRQAQELIKLHFGFAHAIPALWAGVGMIWLGATLSRK